MGGEEVFDLVPHAGVAEGAGIFHNHSAAKRTTQIRDLAPVRPYKIPRELSSGWISHHAGDHPQAVLRTDFGRNCVLQSSIEQFGIAEAAEYLLIEIFFLWSLRRFEPRQKCVIQ